ncbi:MAG: RNA polymerase sigma factor [bacterium]|nr:RNA polymerase sigma factor [bacterium]
MARNKIDKNRLELSKRMTKEALELIRDDNLEDFVTLVKNNYHEELKLIALSVLPKEGKDGAEDVVQLVYVRLLKIFNNKNVNFQGKSSLSTWLHRITVNMTLHCMRTEKYKNSKLTFLDEVKLGDVEGDYSEPSISNRVEEQLVVADLVNKAIKSCQIKDNDLWLLEKYYEEGFRVEELAKIIGKTPGSLKARLFKVRAKLRKYISQNYVNFRPLHA